MRVLIKLLVVFAAFYFVYRHINLEQFTHYIRSFSITSLIIATLLIIIAQYVSALRSRFYFNKNGLAFSRYFSTALYFTGSLYNTILPGGIGGDAYKIFFLAKHSALSKKTIFRVLLSERANGLYLLLLLGIASLYCSHLLSGIWLFGAAIIISAGYVVCAHFLLLESTHTILGASLYSFLIQSLYCLAAFVILKTLGISLEDPSLFFRYLSLFLLSNILAVIPISINGIGVRELTFLYGSSYLSLNQELGIALGVIYFTAYFLMALCGFTFRPQENQLEDLMPG